MKKLLKPFIIILVCTLVVFGFSMIYGCFIQKIPEDVVILPKDVNNYKAQNGIILFCKLLFATLATGVATGFSWAFATEADPKKHRNSAFMLPQLKNVLIVVTACTLLFVVAADLIQPVAEMKQNRMLQDAVNFRDYTALAKQHEAKQEYVKARFYAETAYNLNPKDVDAKRYANDMAEAVTSMDDYIEIVEAKSEEKELLDSLDYLKKANEAWNANNFWDAHYYATCAEDLSPRDDETKKEARELAARAWNMLGSYTEGVSAATVEIYDSKIQAYRTLIEEQDTLQAYYAFKKLVSQYPKDDDIQKYYALAEARLNNLYFYTDEIDDVRSLEKFNNVTFKLSNIYGGKDLYEIKGITVVENAGQLVQYLRDMRITKTDANGNVHTVLNVPYAKMTAETKESYQTRLTTASMSLTPTKKIDQTETEKEKKSEKIKIEYAPFMLLESVNKNTDIEELHIRPEWIKSAGEEVPSYIYLEDMPYDDFTLIRQASAGPELMPLISLFKFVSKADEYGFSSAQYRTSLILRLSLPLFVLTLLLYMAVIGWGLRLEPDQPFKTRWLLMFPLLTFVMYVAKDLLLYILKLIVFILCAKVAGIALWCILAAGFIAVFLTCIYFLKLRSE